VQCPDNWERGSIIKTVRVKEVYGLHGTASDLLPEDTSLEYIIDRFAHEPGLREVFLVDSRQKLSGMLTRTDMLKWIHLQLYGWKGRREISISEFFRFVDAKKAKDLIRTDPRSVAVKETDTLQTVLDKMLDSEEDVLPVVDDEFKVIGDLRMSEVFLKAVEIGKQKDQNEWGRRNIHLAFLLIQIPSDFLKHFTADLMYVFSSLPNSVGVSRRGCLNILRDCFLVEWSRRISASFGPS
jgi:CBS-domain-containing membrane protein